MVVVREDNSIMPRSCLLLELVLRALINENFCSRPHVKFPRFLSILEKSSIPYIHIFQYTHKRKFQLNNKP